MGLFSGIKKALSGSDCDNAVIRPPTNAPARASQVVPLRHQYGFFVAMPSVVKTFLLINVWRVTHPARPLQWCQCPVPPPDTRFFGSAASRRASAITSAKFWIGLMTPAFASAPFTLADLMVWFATVSSANRYQHKGRTDIQGTIAFFLQAHHLTGRIQSGNGDPPGAIFL